jgi:transposase
VEGGSSPDNDGTGRHCQTARACLARRKGVRRAEGKTDREIRRCLKRYITRELYRALTTAMTT